VGDIHGCLDVLHRALRALHFQPSIDRLFSVGDLVDRGPESLACLGLLRMPWFHPVMGNHESFLIRHLEGPDRFDPADRSWLDATGRTFTERRTLAHQWLPWLQALPYVIQVGPADEGFQVIHGELVEDGTPVTNAMVEQWAFSDPRRAAERVLGGRSLIRTWLTGQKVQSAHAPDLRLTFCGHSIVPAPLQLARQVYLDGGAFLGHTHSPQAQAGSYSLEEKPRRPGLIIAEPGQGRYWFAPTHPRGGPNIEPVDLMWPDTR
jgi:serine/threonine protein phosphatase 1